MGNLPSGTRRVYNHFYKRKATGFTTYTPTPSEVKDYLESQNFNPDELTEEQFTQAINHFSKGELSTQVNSDSHNQESSIIHPGAQEIKDIVSHKAQEMSLELSSIDVDYVAGQIDSTSLTLDEVLSQVEEVLCAYADHKRQEGIAKIDSMFGRVYGHVQSNNSQTSSHISQKLRQFGNDVEASQQDFKSSITTALDRLRVSSNSA